MAYNPNPVNGQYPVEEVVEPEGVVVEETVAEPEGVVVEEVVAEVPTAAAPPPVVKPDMNADLFEVPQPEDSDMNFDDVVAAYQGEDIGDLLRSATSEDINGAPPRPRQRPGTRRVLRRRIIRQAPPPSQMGGLR